MIYLLDTHALLWFLNGDERINQELRTLLEDSANDVLVSDASLWEIAIKINLGKLKLPEAYATFIPSQLESNSFQILKIRHSHLVENINLPLHHRDPFDRLIIAQAVAESLPVITRDDHFKKYPIQIVW